MPASRVQVRTAGLAGHQAGLDWGIVNCLHNSVYATGISTRSSGSLRFEDVVARDVGLDTEGVEDAVVSVHDQDAIGADGSKRTASVKFRAQLDGMINIPKNSLDTVGDCQESLVAEFGPDGRLDPSVRLVIDTGRRFVQADDLAVAHECPRERDETALADGKIGSLVLDRGIEREA